MDNFAFNDLFDQDRPQRGSRSKPAKRKWREIEALQDRHRLRKELQDIDVLCDLSHANFDL